MLGPIRVVVDRVCFHVRRAEIANPVAGGTLAVGAETFTVEGVQPVERDAEGLLWALEVGWGALIAYRSVTGSGATQNPPQGSGFTIAANAAAGANAVSIRAGFTVGKLVAGDVLTIAGDGTRYVVTADVQASANQFVNVPISPALAQDAAAGAAVTFDFARDYEVRAAVAGYAANEIMGGVQVGDRRLVILQAALDAAGMTDAPKAGDRATFEGRSIPVQTATAIYQGDAPYAWDLQLRG